MDISLKYPRLFIAISLLVLIFFSSFLPKVKTVNNVDYFDLKDNPARKFYDQFRKIFGSDEFFVIAFKDEYLFTPNKLNILKKITNDLESIKLAKDVVSLANVDDIKGGEDFFEVRDFLEEIPNSVKECERLKKEAIQNPLYRDNLISKDGSTAAIVVITYIRHDDPDYRAKLLRQVDQVLNGYSKYFVFHKAGWTITDYALSQYMKRDLKVFIPITYMLVLFVIWIFFKKFYLVLIALLNISACMMSTMGLFGLTGIALHNVTSIVPPLIMAMSLADSVHIFSHLDDALLQKMSKIDSLRYIIKRLFLPCFLTTLTTAVGFFSLVSSELSPIRDFALMASAGMVFEFFYAFFLIPPILFYSPSRWTFRSFTKKNDFINIFSEKIYKLTSTHTTKLLVLFFVVVVISIWGATKVRVETDLNRFFMPSTKEYKDLEFIEKNLSGTGSLDVYLKTDIDGFKEPSKLYYIEKLQNFISKIPGVDKVISLNDYLKEMNKSFHNENPKFYKIPETKNMVSQFLLLFDISTIDEFVTESFDETRLSIRLSEHASSKQKIIIQNIEDYLKKNTPKDISAKVTGRALQQVIIIDELVNSQIKSLIYAGATISIIMILVLRSISIGLISLIPNIFPILINFAIMGFVGISLNTATALISAVAIGIAVDDTIHFLSEYLKMIKQEKLSAKYSVYKTIINKGRAIISSSIILFFGFAVLITSKFHPTFDFGMLTSIIMITALIGDLMLLPCILMLKNNKR